MTRMQRVMSVVQALFMVACAILILRYSDYGYQIVSLLVWGSLGIAAIRDLVYYFGMARHMVGGKTFLYKAVLFCDLSLFAGSLYFIPRSYVLIYLIVIFGFTGAVGVLRAREAKGLGASSWRLNMAQGLLNIAVAVVCLANMGSTGIVELAYSLGLMASAALKLIDAFRPSAVIYIP